MRALILASIVLCACGNSSASDDAGSDGAPAGDAGFDGTLADGDANVPDDGGGPFDAGCGTGILTQLSATPGAVVSGSIAHAGNDDALAVWFQYDSADGGTSGAMYGAEHQGCTWGAPVQIEKWSNLVVPHPPVVVANGSTFVMLRWLGDFPPKVWTGSGVTPATGTFGDGLLGSDGTTFVDVTYNNLPGYSSMTSTDGLTWTPAAQAETVGSFEQLASGPGGVLAWSYDGSTQQARARVWRKGAWSAPALLPSNGFGSCVAAVGNADAAILCRGPNPGDGGPNYLDVELFDGSWHDLPPPVQTGFISALLLATDGTDYRLDDGITPMGTILHAGAWSTTVSDSIDAYGTAGRSGQWTAMKVDVQTGYSISRAAGLTGFPAPTSLVPQKIPIGTWIGSYGAPFSGWPGRTDVAFVDLSGDGGVNTLYVALDL